MDTLCARLMLLVVPPSFRAPSPSSSIVDEFNWNTDYWISLKRVKKNFRVFSWAGYFISQSRRRRQFKLTTYLIMLNLNNKLKQEKEQSRPNINLEPESLCMSILLSLRACQVHKVKTRHLDASHASFAFLKQAHKQLLYARRHMFLKLHVTYT